MIFQLALRLEKDLSEIAVDFHLDLIHFQVQEEVISRVHRVLALE